MIASSASQYLHPEPQVAAAAAQADSTVSPLALLVQTCSAIGKDSSSSKQLASTLGRIAAEQEDGIWRSAGGAGACAATSATAASSGGGRPSVRSSPPNRASSAEPPRSHESTSPTYRPKEVGERRKSLSPADGYARSASAHRKPAARDPRSFRTAAAPEPTMPVGLLPPPPSGPVAAGFPSSYASLYHHWLPYFSQLAAAESAQQQAARSHAEKAAYSALTHNALHPAPCRDAGCMACHLSRAQQQMPSAAAAAAAAAAEHYAPGCPCCLDKLRGFANAASALPPLLPHLNAAAAAFLAAVRPPMAPGGQVQVCHWVSGSDYCGKQFATIDDLLQHVKTHAASDASTGSSAGASLSQHSPAASAVATPLAAMFGRAAAAPAAPPAAVAATLAASRAATHGHSARLHPYAKQYHGSQPSGGGELLVKSPPAMPVDLSSSQCYLSSPYAALFGPGGIGSAASR